MTYSPGTVEAETSIGNGGGLSGGSKRDGGFAGAVVTFITDTSIFRELSKGRILPLAVIVRRTNADGSRSLAVERPAPDAVHCAAEIGAWLSWMMKGLPAT